VQKTQVIVFTTGGTVEKTYDELQGVLENREPLIQSWVQKKLRLPHTQLEIRPIMAKDSLYMTDEDRHVIATVIKSAFSESKPIVVLHGTDSMENTAEYCFRELGKVAVPVVFTGAMRPLGYEDSDAPQNFIEALMASQLVAPGIYLSFHNHLFKVPKVTKNKQLGTFTEP
jgi:L-asparaginase